MNVEHSLLMNLGCGISCELAGGCSLILLQRQGFKWLLGGVAVTPLRPLLWGGGLTPVQRLQG